MVDSTSFSAYLGALQSKLATGDATEHTHRSALETLVESFDEDIKVINEPKRIECGAPDLAIHRDGFMVGHIEAKDVGTSLDAAERSDQLKRYLLSLPNLILTDYLEFRWFADGDHRRSVKLGHLTADGSIRRERGAFLNVAGLLCDFLAHEPQPIGTPRELAERMARLTHLIRDIIITAFEKAKASDLLKDWRKAFAEVLVAELDEPENVGQFADMFAQTLAYGLFSARILHERGNFTRQRAQGLIPKTNPFLRDFFYYITGPQLEDEPYAGIVEDLVQLLALADMPSILADFGKRTRQEDPTLHFYETFLAAYDPELRDRRGVRYTPNPVVSYIARSVDALLKDRFGLPRGLADTTRLPDGTHKLLLLDPACGTATFLYSVIDLIRQDFMKADNAGLWSGYVREHLLPRIFGFELLMAPYAVAHFKLAMQLSGHDLPVGQREQWAYDFESGERINVYLTNSLEAPEHDYEQSSYLGLTRILAEEAQEASAIKKELPIMVVLGNPPYSGHSANDNPWIDGLLKGELPDGVKVSNYYQVDGHRLHEQNTKWLQDDYVKFIRFGQHRIEETGAGILAYITNNGYLDNPTFRGMRQSLMDAFTSIYVLNLHGDSRKQETKPDGGPDKNVFDIQQGVAITIFVREPGKEGKVDIYYSDLWGTREEKYRKLTEHDIRSIATERLNPVSPFYLFVPWDTSALARYEEGWKVTDAYPVHGVNLRTHRDSFVLDFNKTVLKERLRTLRNEGYSNADLRERFQLRDTRDWSFDEARCEFADDEQWESKIRRCYYRPFDWRWIYYDSSLVEYPSYSVVGHFRFPNTGFTATRQTTTVGFEHVLATSEVTELKCASHDRGSYSFPAYLYPENASGYRLFEDTATSHWEPDADHGNRVPNLSKAFVEDFEGKLGMSFDPHKTDNTPDKVFGPRDVLAYIYAILHCPTYRERYAEFLKIDFPRVPLTSDVDLFWKLVGLGSDLIDLHLMDHPKLSPKLTSFPIRGSNQVKPRGGFPKFVPSGESRTKTGEVAEENRVYINLEQYFKGVPEAVWEFQVGGYQVLHKWLKDRKGRVLSYDNLEHYQKVVVALKETMRLMDEIDETIPQWPIE